LGKNGQNILIQIFTHWLCERFENHSPKEIAMILKLPDLRNTLVAREYLKAGLEKGIAKGLEEGGEKGREEGREEGREAMRESILRVGTKHFGAAPVGWKKRRARLSMTDFSAAFRRFTGLHRLEISGSLDQGKGLADRSQANLAHN
jgi:hypothetical protein